MARNSVTELPANSTRLQRVLSDVDTVRADGVGISIQDLWDPWRCPSELLPFLAWAVSVDVWSNDWSEARKRAVVAASPAVHRVKGTLGAVRRALAAFELETRIIEWWQDGGRRGTFRVEIIYQDGGPVFDVQTHGFAIQSVAAAKPKSRVFTTVAVLRARGPLYVGATSQMSITAVAHPYEFGGSTIRASSYLGATAATLFNATAHRKV